MTLRNWAIGYYIVEYEQRGNDRAEYGIRLLKILEEQIAEKGMNSTLFKLCRQFYVLYPQIGATVSHQFITKPDVLVNNLSFSHIREIMAIADGIDCRGYYVWSFTDLLSWLNGYQKQYGFVYIDRNDNLKRYKKDSFYWYQTLIENKNK